MDADQFQDLYKLLRGNREAITVLDAKALFMEKKTEKAYQKLSESRETFVESHSRVLKQSPEQQLDPKARDADRQLKKLKRKQDKTIEIVKAYDEMLPQLEKLAERELRRRELEENREPDVTAPEPQSDAAAETNEASDVRIARSSDLNESLIAALSEAKMEQRLNIINESFGFREVQSDEDLHGDALYYVQTSKAAILACTPSVSEMSELIHLTSVIDQRPIKPFSRSAFIKLGTSRKMVLLTVSDNREDLRENEDEPEAPSGSLKRDQPRSDGETPDEDSADQNVLDLGAFSQLLTSAQRSGLVTDADQIGYVRDREFRMGKYELAFQTIDAMFTRFMSSAGQRTQNLAREDADISAGRIKISPKDLQAKRSRERAQTQEIERAKRRFQVVIEGLRVLMNSDP